MHTDTLIGMELGTSTLQRLIKRGDREVIFLAQQSHLQHQVVVKVLLPMPDLTPDQHAAFLERFLRETDVIASLEHPNIMPIYEHGERDGLAYVVMPYIAGHTLHDEIRREGPLPLEKAVFYLEQIAAALDCAHEHGVIHRDIHPANIFLSHKGHLLLNGFGLEKIIPRRDNANSHLTRARAGVETLDYIAPEQITGDSVDMRTDQYALGVMLYEMVTGLVPFKGDFPLQVLMQHLNTQAPSPRLLRPDLPLLAEQILLKALAKRPEQRYMYVRNFAHAFSQAFIVSGMPSTGFSQMSTDNLLDLVMQTPHSAASSQHREVWTEKQSAVNPEPPTAYLNSSPAAGRQHREVWTEKQSAIKLTPLTRHLKRNWGAIDIVERTSLKLPSMASLVELAAAYLSEGRDRNNIVERTSLRLPSMADLVLPTTEPHIRSVQARSRVEVGLYTDNIVTETQIQAVQIRQSERFDAQPEALPTGTKAAGQTTRPVKRVSLRSFILTALFILLVSGASVGVYATTIGSANRSLPLHEQIPNGYQDGHSAPGTRSFRVGAQPFIEIKGHSSNVSIHSGSAGIISVKTINNGGKQGLKPDNTGIQYYQSRDGQGNDHVSIAAEPAHSNVDYDVTVPSAAQVKVEVNSGSVAIDGVSGVTIDTNGGNLDIEDVQGPVNVHTENGDITVHNVKGQMTVEGGSGSIKVNNVNGQLNAVTRNGDVIVRGATISGLSALKTTNGSVRFEGVIDPKGTYTMETNRGDVDLTLPADAAFQLHASTASGSIHNEFAGNAVGSMPRAQITVSIGSGGSVFISKVVSPLPDSR